MTGEHKRLEARGQEQSAQHRAVVGGGGMRPHPPSEKGMGAYDGVCVGVVGRRHTAAVGSGGGEVLNTGR